MLRGLNPSSVYFEDWNGVMRPLQNLENEIKIEYNVVIDDLRNAALQYEQQASITFHNFEADWREIMKTARLDPPPEVLKPSLKRRFKEIRIGRKVYK